MVDGNDVASEHRFDVTIAATDVPGIKRLLPDNFRKLDFFDKVYKLSGVPVATVQLRFDGWVTELADMDRWGFTTRGAGPKDVAGDKSDGKAPGIDNLLYSADADFSCFADLALTSPAEYYKPGEGSLLQCVLTPADKYMAMGAQEVADRTLEQVGAQNRRAQPLPARTSPLPQREPQVETCLEAAPRRATKQPHRHAAAPPSGRPAPPLKVALFRPGRARNGLGPISAGVGVCPLPVSQGAGSQVHVVQRGQAAGVALQRGAGHGQVQAVAADAHPKLLPRRLLHLPGTAHAAVLALYPAPARPSHLSVRSFLLVH